jgi:plasmid stabilization system protein ParE
LRSSKTIRLRNARATRCARGLRSFAATPHVVFYRVVNDTPEIVRVLDGRQDIEEKFAARDGE